MNLFDDYTRARQRAGRAAARCAARGFDVWRDLRADAAAREQAAAVLARVGLAGKERAPARGLSYGERRALEIAVALAAEPRLLFLDEPTAGLGAEGTARLAELIAELKRQLTIVIIEHDMRFLFRLADTVSVIHWGQVIARGTPAELRENPWVQRSNLGALAGMTALMLRARRRRHLLRRDAGAVRRVARGRPRRGGRAARRRTAPARRRCCARSSA